MIATLKYYARIYFLIEAQYIKARMQYRADFIISSVGMLVANAASLMVFWTLFQTIPSLAGWDFYEIIFIYSFYLLAVSPAQIFFDHVWQLRWQVAEGRFIKYYFRPLNMMFYYMSEMVDLKGFAQLALGIGAMAYASMQLGISWDIGRLLLLGVSVLSASLVVTSMLIIAASSCFWVPFSFAILDFAFKMREYSQYPTSIFNGFFRFLFTYLIPIGFVAFYPSQLFLRPEQVSGLIWASPLIGIAMFALAYRVWEWGVNSYTGTGS